MTFLILLRTICRQKKSEIDFLALTKKFDLSDFFRNRLLKYRLKKKMYSQRVDSFHWVYQSLIGNNCTTPAFY